MRISGIGRASDASRCPAIGAGVIFGASVQIALVISAPDDHLAASPYSRVMSSRISVNGARCNPVVGGWIISSATVQN